MPSGTICRTPAAPCDALEVCDGSSRDCPADARVSAGTICREAAGACDVAEMCDGAASDCPADGMIAAGTVCRAAADVCDVAEACDGAGATCPADAIAAAGTACRPAAGPCDAVEACDGATTGCGGDTFIAANTACGEHDICDGAGACRLNLLSAGIGCGSGPQTGDSLCRGLGFGRATQAVGYWWGQCAGTGDLCPGGWQGDGTACPDWCPGTDCGGMPFCASSFGWSVHTRSGDGSTSFAADEFQPCAGWNPGWTVRVRCEY
jgi:hypothetical protein